MCRPTHVRTGVRLATRLPGEPLHGDCTEGFLLKNLYCLECRVGIVELCNREDTNTHTLHFQMTKLGKL